MTQVSVNNGFEFPFVADLARPMYNNSAFGYTTIDATGERVAFLGQVFINGRPGSAKTFGGGSSALSFMLGATTFANGSSTLEISMQDIAGSIPPTPDGTRDSYITLTGSGLTANAWNTKSFASATGTKSVSHGDRVAIVFDFTNRAGADTIAIVERVGSSIASSLPMTLHRTGGTWAQAFYDPLCLITFSDGTLGWIWPDSLLSGPTALYQATAADNPDEYGLMFQVPWDCKVEALNGFFYTQGTAVDDTVFTLYADPLGTPSVLASITIDGDEAPAAYSGTMRKCLLTSLISLTKNTNYALALRATSTGYFYMAYGTVADETHRVAIPNGSNLCKVTRNNNTGAFTAQSPALEIPRMSITISSFEDSAGAGGVKFHPGMNGGLNG